MEQKFTSADEINIQNGYLYAGYPYKENKAVSIEIGGIIGSRF